MGELWDAAKEAGLWSWSPADWAWSPETVRWSLDLGMPKAPVYFDVSTDAMPAHARYELWRTLLYYSFEGDPLPAEAAHRFCARTQCLITDPVQLIHYRSKAVSGRGVPAHQASDRETYTIGVVVKGARTHTQEGAAPVVSRPGDFFVFDNRWTSRVAWSDHRAVQISVPRVELEQRIGGRIPDPAAMVHLLGGSHMGAVLKCQMLLAVQHMAAANAAEREFMLGQMMQLALFACESVTAHSPLRALPRADLLGAALALIEQNLGRPGLDARMLQAHLGCSRATLYRAFAEAGTSVSNAIAQLRIKRAKGLLAGSPDLPVAVVAARCGWYDGASFARAFRRHEGLSPSEFREKYRAT